MSVDIENTLWAVYNKNTSKVERRYVKWPRLDGGELTSLPDHIVYLLHEDSVVKPDYDSATQKLQVVENVNLRTKPKKLQKIFEVVPLTQEELDEIASRPPVYFETSTGIQLDISDAAQNAFSRMLNLVNLQEMADSDIIQIHDYHDVAHNISVAEFKAMLKEYGAYCYSLFVV